jgi:Beta-galactosidase C-terminal domain
VFLVNHTTAEVPVELPGELLTGGSQVGGTVCVPPGGVAVVRTDFPESSATCG